jgi:hypothetical protein
MEFPENNLLHSEVILKELGYERLFRWKINNKNYMIQLCPKKVHVHILTTQMVQNIHNNGIICPECEGRNPRNLSDRLNDIYQYENLMFKLIGTMDRIEVQDSYLWKELNSNLLGQSFISRYQQMTNKYLFSSNCDLEISKGNLDYINIILNLDRENQKLRDNDQLLNEIIYEQNDMITQFKRFLNSNIDIFDQFNKFYHSQILTSNLIIENLN